MTERSATHAIFTVERTYPVPPARVFKAFSSEKEKARWFSGSSEWEQLMHDFDFRPGGIERLKGRWPNGTISYFDCRYQDIVPDERIVYAYNMEIDGRLISVSLATIEFKRSGAGTRLVLTEQGVYLDGYEDGGGREHGTNYLIDKMGATLADEAVGA
jgi:uncharacterized protein YndB with AHSA1/START domain